MFGRIARIALALTFSTLSVTQPWAASFLEKNFWLSGPRYDRDMLSPQSGHRLDWLARER